MTHSGKIIVFLLFYNLKILNFHLKTIKTVKNGKKRVTKGVKTVKNGKKTLNS